MSRPTASGGVSLGKIHSLLQQDVNAVLTPEELLAPAVI
jgi:hypothetical protein